MVLCVSFLQEARLAPRTIKAIYSSRIVTLALLRRTSESIPFLPLQANPQNRVKEHLAQAKAKVPTSFH